MKKLIIAVLVPASFAFAGPISFGVKGGVPFTDALDAAKSGDVGYVSKNKYWTVGPELDLNLPFGLAIEVDAMYRRLNFESTQTLTDSIKHISTSADSWEFPLLLKWKLSPGPIRPYVSAGPTFRDVTSIHQVTSFFEGQPGYRDRFNTGFTVAGGVQILKHISPEIRYTRWGWSTFTDTSGLLKSNPNQLSFLVGLTF